MISSFITLLLSLSLICAQTTSHAEPTLQVIPTNVVRDDPTLPSRIHSNIVNVGIRDTMNPRQWAEALASVSPITIPATDTPIHVQLDLIPIRSTVIEPTAPIATTLTAPAPAPVAPSSVSTSPPLRLYSSVPPLSITSSPSCPIMPFTNQIRLSSSTPRGNIYTIYFVPSLPITHVRALSVTGHVPSSIEEFTHTQVMEYDTTNLVYNVTLATAIAPGERLYLAFQYGLPSTTTPDTPMICTTPIESFERATFGWLDPSTSPTTQTTTTPTHTTQSQATDLDGPDHEFIDLDNDDTDEMETLQAQDTPAPAAIASTTITSSPNTETNPEEAAAGAAAQASITNPNDDTHPYIPSAHPECASDALSFTFDEAYPVRDRYSVYKVDMKTTEILSVKKAEVHLSHDVELNDLMSVVPLEFTSPHEFHHVLSSVPLKKDDALYLFFTIEKENGEICDSVLSMVSVE